MLSLVSVPSESATLELVLGTRNTSIYGSMKERMEVWSRVLELA